MHTTSNHAHHHPHARAHVHYRPIHGHELGAVCHLAASVFCEDVAASFEPEGVAEFLRFLSPGELAIRLHHESAVFVADLNQQFIGMLEVRDWDHISLLFVAKARQGQGVGRQFVQLAIAACRQHKPGIGEITVSATPNAVPFYTRLGFRACAAEKLEIGMRFTPMALKV